MKPVKPTQKVANVPNADKMSYVEMAKQYNSELTTIDAAFDNVEPLNRKVIVRCVLSPEPIQIEVRVSDSANGVQRMLHPKPLLPFGVVIASDVTSGFTKGDLVQFPMNFVMAQNAVNVPAEYIVPFETNPFGYVILDSHVIQCKLKELPKFTYPTIGDAE